VKGPGPSALTNLIKEVYVYVTVYVSGFRSCVCPNAK
jgi:hypothetical protein